MTDEFDSDFMRSTTEIDRPGNISSGLDSAVVLREQACLKIRESLRAGQQDMADWQGGPLAVFRQYW